MLKAMPQALVSLSALSHNLSIIRRYLKPQSQILAAVKANAYGHGAVAVAKHLESLGVTWFGVATASEAIELRQGGLKGGILIFSPVYQNIRELVDYGVSLTVAGEESLEVIKASKAKATIHLKVDTGMGRLGLAGQEAVQLAKDIMDANLELEGVWTHFATSDDQDKTFAGQQLEAFEQFLRAIEHQTLQPKIVHCANSSAIFALPHSHFDAVRPGIALHGYHSSPYIATLEPGLKPVMTLSAPITFVKKVKAGTPVSYSHLWIAPKDTTIATVRIGYADGYPRLLTNKGEVWVQDRLCPIAGRVCMDQLLVDVGDLDVAIGDRVTLFGGQGLDAEILGNRYGTISYDVLTGISPRVERVYI
jgi:alanine racemase